MRGSGSLQQKRGLWYFVAKTPDGKLKWTALKTRDKQEASRRAAAHAGTALRTDDRDAWLQSLVDAGEWARRELVGADARTACVGLAWDELFEAWRNAAQRLTTHGPTLTNYELQIGVLARWARNLGIETPPGLSALQANAYALERAKMRSSAGRDVALFKRVWRDLGMVPVWQGAAIVRGGVKAATRYRRLTVDEVRQIVRVLRKGKKMERKDGKFVKGAVKALPDIADLVFVGYHTGLRRGDCVSLTVRNVDGDFLRVIPAKTEGRKGRVLLIPMQKEVRAVIDRLAKNASEAQDIIGEKLLFPRLAGAWLNKCLGLAWERADVKDNDFGRASFHSLRATFISAMDEAGVPPHVCDAITGHAPAGMHGRYSQPGRDALMDAVKRAIVPLGV